MQCKAPVPAFFSSQLPPALEKYGYYFKLNTQEAEDFLEMFPKNKNFFFFRESSQLGCITVTQLLNGKIQHTRVAYRTDQNKGCLFSFGGKEIPLHELTRHFEAPNSWTQAMAIRCQKGHISVEIGQPRSHINNNQFCANYTVESAEKILSRKHTSNDQVAVKDFVVFVPGEAGGEISAVFGYSNGNRFTRPIFNYTVDESGNYRYSMVINQKAVISDCEFVQLTVMFSGWGFNVLSGANMRILEAGLALEPGIRDYSYPAPTSRVEFRGNVFVSEENSSNSSSSSIPHNPSRDFRG